MNRQALCDAPNKCHIAFISVTENVTVRYHHHKNRWNTKPKSTNAKQTKKFYSKERREGVSW